MVLSVCRLGGLGGLAWHVLQSSGHPLSFAAAVVPERPSEVFLSDDNGEPPEVPQQETDRSGRRSLRIWPPYTFLPLGGVLYGDIVPMAFFDHDPTSGIRDWDCTDYTYDGHEGVDFALRSFGEQQIGVPVFAALAGTVLARHDGEEDRHTWRDPTRRSNYVAIAHGGGHFTAYLHLRKGSVLVAVGQHVRAGEQIGQVGSSGVSNGPHLHFETWFEDSRSKRMIPYDPYAGDCRPGESGWQSQLPIVRSPYIWDFGVTHENMASFPGPPHAFPRGGQIQVAHPEAYFWVKMRNFPAGGNWRATYQRPDGTIAGESGPQEFQRRAFAQGVWQWWKWRIPEPQLRQGTWSVVFEVDGRRMLTAPFEVRDRPGPNRPPAPIAVTLSPHAPTADEVLVCRVHGHILLDDPDYDIVRYEYLWTVHGQVVRRVTSAALADVLPHHTAQAGEQVTCQVYPSDGINQGETRLSAVTIQQGTSRHDRRNWAGTPSVSE